MMNKMGDICACLEKQLLIPVEAYAIEYHKCQSSRIFMTAFDKITKERNTSGSGVE